MLTVDSGHTVVHRLSTNASTTTLPWNCRSETGVPDWSVRVNPGAGVPGRLVPGSTSGFRFAALASARLAGGEPDPPPDVAASTVTRTAAHSTGTPNAMASSARPRGERGLVLVSASSSVTATTPGYYHVSYKIRAAGSVPPASNGPAAPASLESAW